MSNTDHLIGKTLLDQYRVEQWIASGGMSTVYRIWDLSLEKFMAMKILNSDLASNSIFVETFRKEARILHDLTHPNIVRFHGIHNDGMIVFILQEFIEGHTLQKLLADCKKMSTVETLIYMRPLCAALEYAHGKQIIHGDLKPGNVLLDGSGRVFLTDFGLAQYGDHNRAVTPSVIAGTPAYMAPEQIRGEPVTAATDVYALGLILFEMLTGQHPFQVVWEAAGGDASKKSEKMRYAHLHLEPENPRKVNAQLTEPLSKIIMRALEKNPSRRYKTIEDFYSALDVQIAKEAQTVARTSIVFPSAPGNKQKLSLYWQQVIGNWNILRRPNDQDQSLVTENAKALLEEYELVFPLHENTNFDNVFMGREIELNRFLASLTTTQQGIWLVSGQRGTGKTTFVKHALNELGNRLRRTGEVLVSVSVQLSFLHVDMDVMHILLRELNNSLKEFKFYNYIDKDIRDKIENILTRFENSTQVENVSGTDYSVNVGMPSAPTIGVSAGRSRRVAEKKTPHEYTPTMAKQDLIKILQQLRSCQIPYEGSKIRMTVVFVIDELDKVEEVESINEMLNSLKPIFTSAGTYFVLFRLT